MSNLFGVQQLGIGTKTPQGALDVRGEVRVAGNIVPLSNEAYDLGASNARFRDLFLSGNTIDMAGLLLQKSTAGSLEVRDRSTNSLQKLVVDELQIGSSNGFLAIKKGEDNRIQIELVDSNADPTSTQQATMVPNLYSVASNIGIGTSNPSYPLDIQGNMRINGHILPASNEIFDLGSSNMRFRDLYLSGNTINLGDQSISVNSNGQVDVGSNVFAINVLGVNIAASSNLTTPALTAASINATSLGLSGNAQIAGKVTANSLEGRLDQNIVEIGTSNASAVYIGTASRTQTVNIGTGDGVTTINLGGAGDTVNVAGTLAYVNTTNLQVTDSLITLNKGGAAGSGGEAGIRIEENENQTAYLQTSATRDAWRIKAPATAGEVLVVPGASGFTLSESNVWTAASSNVYRSAGGVGIGKTPSYPLDVVGDINFTGQLRSNGVAYAAPTSSQFTTNGATVSLIGSNLAIGKTVASSALDVVGDVNITGSFKINGTNATINGGTQTCMFKVVRNTNYTMANNGIVLSQMAASNVLFDIAPTPTSASSGFQVSTSALAGYYLAPTTGYYHINLNARTIDLSDLLGVRMIHRSTNGTLTYLNANGQYADKVTTWFQNDGFGRRNLDVSLYVYLLAGEGVSAEMAANQTPTIIYAEFSGFQVHGHSGGSPFIVSGNNVSLPAGSNLGVGTDAPAARLHVTHPTRGILRLEETATGQQYNAVQMYGPSTSCEVGHRTDTGLMYFANPANSGENTAKMVITSDGKVGIGTTNPAGMLHVNTTPTILGAMGGNDLIINDIAGAKWKLNTGGYNLTFSQHTGTNNDDYSTWATRAQLLSGGGMNLNGNLQITGNIVATNASILYMLATPFYVERQWTSSILQSYIDLPASIPSGAKAIYADVFLTNSESDHLNVNLGAENTVDRDWVETRGGQPSSFLAPSVHTRKVCRYTMYGQLDNFSSFYGYWQSGQTIPIDVVNKRLFWSVAGYSSGSGWVYVNVKGYYM